MPILITLALTILPTFGSVGNVTFDDGPWIAIPAGMSFDAQKSPAEEIRSMADLDGDPTITTAEEIKMIALLTQILGAEPLSQ